VTARAFTRLRATSDLLRSYRLIPSPTKQRKRKIIQSDPAGLKNLRESLKNQEVKSNEKSRGAAAILKKRKKSYLDCAVALRTLQIYYWW
jgi:hypothetical protein